MGSTSSGTPTNDYYYYRCRSKYNVKSSCTNGRGVRADALEQEVWKKVHATLRRLDRLRAGLKKMIESKRELLATDLWEQIARWVEQIHKAKTKRLRYQDQEAEGLMTREELRIKLAELDETVSVVEAEIEKLRHHEERIQTMEKNAEELLVASS